MSNDFAKGKRGAVVQPDLNKTRITIRLDSQFQKTRNLCKNSILIKNNANLRSLECARLKKRLRPAIKEQCGFLDECASFADDNRI